MDKILNNHEALLAILDGKIVKSIDGVKYQYSEDCIQTIKSNGVLFKSKHFNNCNEFTLVEPERETITLYEHIGDFGQSIFLNNDKKYISFRAGNNTAVGSKYQDKYHKLYRNDICQTVKVWADTLEYVQEGE